MTSNNDKPIVIFDLGGVLGDGWSYERAFEHYKQKFPFVQFALVCKYARTQWNEFKIGKITEIQFWNNIIASMQEHHTNTQEPMHNITAQEFAQFVQDNFDVFYSSLAVAERLGKRGYRIGILSNHSKEWFWPAFDRLKLDTIFTNRQMVVVSCDDDVAVAKPEPLVYAKLMERIEKVHGNVDKQNIVFIDDKLENVTAAQQFGIQAIQYNANHMPVGKLVAALQQFGIDAAE